MITVVIHRCPYLNFSRKYVFLMWWIWWNFAEQWSWCTVTNDVSPRPWQETTTSLVFFLSSDSYFPWFYIRYKIDESEENCVRYGPHKIKRWELNYWCLIFHSLNAIQFYIYHGTCTCGFLQGSQISYLKGKQTTFKWATACAKISHALSSANSFLNKHHTK